MEDDDLLTAVVAEDRGGRELARAQFAIVANGDKRLAERNFLADRRIAHIGHAQGLYRLVDLELLS